MGVEPNINDFQKVLIVEGYSDLLFFAELLEHVGLHSQVFIKHFNGNKDLAKKINDFVTPQLLIEKNSVGVVMDADADAARTVQSLQHTLQRVTGRTLSHSVWSPPQSGEAKVGFFVVPNGVSNGEIETLVWNSWCNIPENSAPRVCIDSYLACMSTQGHSAKSPDKGKIGALLSVLSDEDPRLGPGARTNVFNFTRPEFAPLLDFLREI